MISEEGGWWLAAQQLGWGHARPPPSPSCGGRAQRVGVREGERRDGDVRAAAGAEGEHRRAEARGGRPEVLRGGRCANCLLFSFLLCGTSRTATEEGCSLFHNRLWALGLSSPHGKSIVSLTSLGRLTLGRVYLLLFFFQL